MTATNDPTSTPPEPDTLWSVRLELKRVQTYLFAVPRLNVMVGANALLGETLRGCWRRDRFDDGIKSLGRLAQDNHSAWPAGIAVYAAEPDLSQDPLQDGDWQDDVAAVAMHAGVLTRDGGHFEALFSNSNDATTFAGAASLLLQEQLPGVLASTAIQKLSESNGRWHAVEQASRTEVDKPLSLARGESVFELAHAEVCQYSGAEPATERPAIGDEHPPVSQSVLQRIHRSAAFNQKLTKDVLGLLSDELRRAVGVPLDRDPFPSEFSQLAVGGQIAVVHVDGNSVGTRYSKFIAQRLGADPKLRDYFQEWRLTEQYFHTLRVGMRRAVLSAVKEIFHVKKIHHTETLSATQTIPLRLLMLGGDDLVLVCGAPFALPFVVALSKRIRETTAQLPDGLRSLSLGAGVAIVPDSFPFYRAHELAEELAESAKRLKSAISNSDDQNVVDWMVTSEAWHGDIHETRQRDCLADGSLILSRKPYPVLKPVDTSNSFKSLESLLDDARQLTVATQSNRAARSQLQALVRQLPRGRHTARFAAEVLPEELKRLLVRQGHLSKEDGPWTTQATSSGMRGTDLLDLLELYELERMS